LIVYKIAQSILINLGTTAKARVEEQLKQKIENLDFVTHDKIDSDNIPLLAGNVARGYTFTDIKYQIKEMFSFCSQSFQRDGFPLEISKYHPNITFKEMAQLGVLQELAKENKLGLTPLEAPNKWKILLTLDKELTQEKAELVFSLTQTSNGIEFSKETFTIKSGFVA
ncbi:MAG: hypothetical protein K1000chlam2_01412, partial [Chlamydiae bacterium]|nr:hypothetical protein [Chlamydiota bacterium]